MKADLEDDWDQGAFRESVAANPQTGRFDLLITDELKQVVRYPIEEVLDA